MLDGRPLPDMPEGVHDGVLVAYATRRGGPNAADDRIADEVAADADPGTLTVVTSDRDLQARVEAMGAQVVGAGAVAQRAGSGTSVTPSSRSTRNVFSTIDTRWYCPTAKTRSSICCSS